MVRCRRRLFGWRKETLGRGAVRVQRWAGGGQNGQGPLGRARLGVSLGASLFYPIRFKHKYRSTIADLAYPQFVNPPVCPRHLTSTTRHLADLVLAPPIGPRLLALPCICPPQDTRRDRRVRVGHGRLTEYMICRKGHARAVGLSYNTPSLDWTRTRNSQMQG